MEKMKKQTFYVEQNGKIRSIDVKVDNDYISFHFKSEGGREFYSIPTKSWANDTGNTWHSHMAYVLINVGVGERSLIDTRLTVRTAVGSKK